MNGIVLAFVISYLAGLAANHTPHLYKWAKKRLKSEGIWDGRFEVAHRKYKTWKTLLYFLILNFATWSWGLFYLGGEAVFGYIKDGAYFLHSSTGDMEVAKDVYYYSLVHTYSVMVASPMVLIAMVKMNEYSMELYKLLELNKREL